MNESNGEDQVSVKDLGNSLKEEKGTEMRRQSVTVPGEIDTPDVPPRAFWGFLTRRASGGRFERKTMLRPKPSLFDTPHRMAGI